MGGLVNNPHQQHQHIQHPHLNPPPPDMSLLEHQLPQPPYPPEPELISRVDCVIKEDPQDLPENGHFLEQL